MTSAAPAAGPLRATRSAFSLALLLAPLCWPAPAPADILHLTNGGTIEGQILERDQQGYRLRTVAGIVKLPGELVERVEAAPSPWAEYDRRRRQAADTPEAQLALARWCRQRGLTAQRRAHLRRAIELDGDCRPAREALGYVRVGPLWVDGRSRPAPARRGPAARPAEREQDKLIAAIRSQWFRRVRAIRNSLLSSPEPRLVEQGRAKILQIRDPLAILPLSRELSGGSRVCRQVLVAALARFPQDEATMNLAALALLDRDEEVRDAALSELKRRDDPRVVAQFRQALKGEDWLVGRAAEGLGRLRAEQAVPDLIEALTARRRRLVEVPVRGYLSGMPQAFGATRVVIGGGVSVVYSPYVGVVLDAAAPAAGVRNELRLREVTVFRTQVLEALKRITGQNLGFEKPRWRRWYEEQRS